MKSNEKLYTFPFSFRFGPNIITEYSMQQSLEFKPNQQYSISEIKNMLSSEVIELRSENTCLFYIEDTNTFIISTLLMKKGPLPTKNAS